MDEGEVKPDNNQITSTSLERYFLALYLFQDEISHQVLKFLNLDDFEDREAGNFWKALRDIIGTSKTVTLKKILNKLPKDFGEFVDELYLVNISPVFSDRELWMSEIAKIANRIKRAMIKRKLAQMSHEIKRAEGEHNSKQLIVLSKKFDALSKNL